MYEMVGMNGPMILLPAFLLPDSTAGGLTKSAYSSPPQCCYSFVNRKARRKNQKRLPALWLIFNLLLAHAHLFHLVQHWAKIEPEI